MFSLDRFYDIIHNNLIDKFTNGKSIYFFPFGTYQNTMLISKNATTTLAPKRQRSYIERPNLHCYFFDQEPLFKSIEPIVTETLLSPYMKSPRRLEILANSEHSEFKRNLVKEQGLYDWYYFYHGFAALDWYRDFQYLSPTVNQFDKVFICYNHLTSKLRSYRLHLVGNLIEQDLVKHGHVSLFHAGWQDTIEDPENPLDNRARVKIYNALKDIENPLVIDTDIPNGEMSAKINFKDLTGALFHVVTETIYFDQKLHLTEKIFKPIIAHRPFILVGAPDNLAYLKSYGFKTFDRWIDESYDNESDHYIRIEKITAEIARLCSMDKSALEQMYLEMQEVLEYNFNHFYGNFKDIIVNELVDNFEHILNQINNGRQPNNHSRYHQRFELSPEYLLEVKTRLKQ